MAVLKIIFVMWLGLVGLGLVAVALETQSSPLSCEAKAGDSNYGRAEFSWFPLGTECIWTQQPNGFDGHEDAGWGLTAYVGVVLTAGLGIGYAFVRYSAPADALAASSGH
jgi:hypothetical protein